MLKSDDKELPEAPPWLIKAVQLFGLTEVQARWRVIRALTKLRDGRQLIGFSRGHRRVVARRIGDFPIATIGILVLIFLVYARMFVARPHDGIVSWDEITLLDFGAYSLDELNAGQWWRLGTANFLHIGLMHLGFNALALTQVGPQIETIFGRGRLMFFFIVTGTLGFATCWALRMDAISAGASASLMGLIGVAAAWGQREGTTTGRALRDQMLKWAVYTIVFGFVIHANNIAHAGGFTAGALLGLCYRLAQRRATITSRVMGVTGALAILACVGICLVSKPSRRLIAPPYVADDGGE